jgi:hypothetical protein
VSDPILGITERWDTDALIEISHTILAPAQCPALPSPLRIRTGAVPGTKGTSQKVLGYYVAPDKAEDKVPSFYISPLVGDTVGALTIMTWLATFAAYPDDDWKKRSNRSHLAERLGFAAPYSTPVAGSNLRVLLDEVALSLVKERPHSCIDVSKNPIIRTQATSLLTGECQLCHGKHRPTLATLASGWPECSGNGGHRRVLINCWSGTRTAGLTPVSPLGLNIPCRPYATGSGGVPIFEPI